MQEMVFQALRAKNEIRNDGDFAKIFSQIDFESKKMDFTDYMENDELKKLNLDDYVFNCSLGGWQAAISKVPRLQQSEIAVYQKQKLPGTKITSYLCVAFDGSICISDTPPEIIPWTHGDKMAIREVGEKNNRNYFLPNDILLNNPQFVNGDFGLTIQDDTLNVKLSPEVCIVMRKIHGGAFIMGSPAQELGRPSLNDFYRQASSLNPLSKQIKLEAEEEYSILRETPRVVKLEKDFWIGQYEITRKQYSFLRGDDSDGTAPDETDVANPEQAAWHVSWDDAMNACFILNILFNGKLPIGYKFSLPLEAQWEYACRAGSSTALNCGSDIAIGEHAICTNLEKVAWYSTFPGEIDMPHSIGEKSPNSWGLYDMHGNVAEWCYDRTRQNPPLPGMTDFRSRHCAWLASQGHALRGGDCFFAQIRNCRSGARYYETFPEPARTGFRLALIPEELAPISPPPFSKKESAQTNNFPVNHNAGRIVIKLPGEIKLVMAQIPNGSFTMGSNEAEIGRTTLDYWHNVFDWDAAKAEAFYRHTSERQMAKENSRSFWLGIFEVTREQYTTMVGGNLSILEKKCEPVTYVRWSDALAFCAKLNELCADQLPEGYHFALPTEEQWEYACRAGTTTALNSGKELTQPEFYCPNLTEVGWFQFNSGEHKREVGLLKPNAWGLYDMHGNVWEWCRCTAPVDDDPLSARILRGGSWYDVPRFCRSAMRRWLDEDRGGPDIGFRVALVPVEE